MQGASLHSCEAAEDLVHGRRQAFAPSITTSSPSSADSPRQTRSASIAFTTVLFSVAPSHNPTGTSHHRP